MEETKLFKIGEVAKMLHVSMGTLRHYEQAGLLTPEYVDKKTGYRYYSARQLEVLNTIRYLRVLDMPLPQIADFLQNRDVDVMREKLLWQKEMIREKKRELELAERKIDHRLERLNDCLLYTSHSHIRSKYINHPSEYSDQRSCLPDDQCTDIADNGGCIPDGR